MLDQNGSAPGWPAAAGGFRSPCWRRRSESLPLRPGAYPSIELNTRTAVPEWDGQEVYIMMEDDAVLTPAGMKYFLPRQTEWFLVQ